MPIALAALGVYQYLLALREWGCQLYDWSDTGKLAISISNISERTVRVAHNLRSLSAISKLGSNFNCDSKWYINHSVHLFFFHVVNLQIGACCHLPTCDKMQVYCFALLAAYHHSVENESTLMPFFGNCISVSVVKITFLETT